MAYIARADGSITPIDSKKVTPKVARDIVGGYVERVCPRKSPRVIFLCDEEGLLKGKPVNAHGCDLYGPTSPIVGDIIVFDRNDAGGWIEEQEVGDE